MTDQQGVNRALYQLASRSVVDSEYELAIKCLIAVLENQPDPDDFAHCSLDLARIYIEHTEDSHKAQERLLQLVRPLFRFRGPCGLVHFLLPFALFTC